MNRFAWHKAARAAALLAAGLLAGTPSIRAQDLDPRRWSHLPVGMNYAGAACFHLDGDVFFDPVLELQDVTVEARTVAAKYLRTFELFDRTARLEGTAIRQEARWEGLLQGSPAWAERSGLADPQARFAINLLGAPPLTRGEFAAYRNAHAVETTAGAGLTLSLPLGEYHEDKLLNLGENRFSFRPELGVEHRRGKWLAEFTGSATLYTENDEFWNGNTREQAPYFAGQTLLSYTFRPGLWFGGGVACGFGGESRINGAEKDDAKENLSTAVVLGVPLGPALGMKFSYLVNDALADTGTDSETLAAAFSALW